MKTENIMQSIKQYVNTLDEDSRKGFEKLTSTGETIPEYFPLAGLVNLYIDLDESLRSEIEKSNGRSKKDGVLKKIFKSSSRKELIEKYIPYHDQFVFTDFYRLYVLNNDFGYKPAETTLTAQTIDKLFPQTSCHDKKLTVDISDLKYFIKTNKETKNHFRPAYVLTDENGVRYGFNAEFLLEFVEMFDTDYIYATETTTAAYYNDDNGEKGILLPVRLTKVN